MSAKWVKFINRDDGDAEILIYDQIGNDWFGGDGVSAKDFAEALKDIPPKKRITVSINSPGGNVWDGLAIYNQLKQRREYVTCRVDGVAASIASVIALSGHRLEMPSNSMLMIHECSGLAMGDSEDMREMAEKLDQHSDLLAGIYAEKTGKSREKMRAMMREETWMSGPEAQSMGFADGVLGEVKLAANFNFSAFRRVPGVLNKTTNNPPSTTAGQPKTDSMNKTAILALLKQHGKTVAEDATDETILAALSDIVAAGKVKQEEADDLKKKPEMALINAAEMRALQAQLKEEKERRIAQEFEVVAADRPYLDRREWLPKLYTDDSLMATLKAMPVIPTGADPIRHSIHNNGNSIIEDYRKMKPGRARLDFALANWHGLEEAHDSARILAMSSKPISEQLRILHTGPQANTYHASLVTDRLADSFITTIGTKLAALRGFSRDFGIDRLKPRATVQVPKATVASTTQTNPTNFESGDSTTVNVAISVNQLSQDFHVTNDELNKGHQLMTVAGKNAQAFANAISDIWTALLLTANYGTATQIGAASSFDAADLAPIYALAKNYGQKNLILDGGHLAYLLPTDKFKFRLGEEGAYNFDLIAEQNRWTSAVTNTVGFVCDPAALAVGSGLPATLPSSEFIELGTVSVESLGLTAQLCHWFSRGGRVHWMSYDIMFGAAVGDETAAEILVTS